MSPGTPQAPSWTETQQWLLEQGVLTVDELCALRGETPEVTRASLLSPPQALVVHHGDKELLPAFQFDDDGAQRPELRDLLHALLAAGRGPWATWTWMLSPTGLLSGQVPAEVALEPGQHHRVERAVQRTIDSVRHARGAF